MRNACLDIALRELAEHGIRDVEVAYGAKHPQLRFRINGGQLRVFAIPGTSSDWRSPQNVRRDLRKLLREGGVIAVSERVRPVSASPPKLDRMSVLERHMRAMEQRIAELEVKLKASPAQAKKQL
jgi:hypothetical protein